MAHADGSRQHEAREAYGNGSTGGDDAGGMLAACRHVGEDAAALHDAGELRLRVQRDVDSKNGSRGSVWRPALWRSGIHTRPAARNVLEQGRRVMAKNGTYGTRREHISDSWIGTGGELHGHQSR